MTREAAGRGGVVAQRRREPGEALERDAVDLRAHVERQAAIGLAVTTGAVEVLEAQTERIHHVVAACAGGFLAVLREALAHGHEVVVGRRWELGIDVFGRRRYLGTAQALLHVVAALGR